MEQVIFISLLSGIATGIGGLIVIWFGTPGYKTLGFYLGISAGMMGMVVFGDLLPASLEYGSIKLTITGLIIGIMIMFIFDKILHFIFGGSVFKQSKEVYQNKYYLNLGFFMTFAIALHNIPEGLAIGAGFESQEELGIRVAVVIALHNIPEGLGVASTLYLGKLKSVYIVFLPLITGFFIPVGTIFSSIIGEMVPDWISVGLSIAAGAMGYLVIKDVGPESMKLDRLLGQFGIAVGILILYIVYHLHH